jgi:LysM repeat protein
LRWVSQARQTPQNRVLGIFRLSSPEPFHVFGALKVLQSRTPSFVLLLILILNTFLANVSLGERSLIKNLFPDPFGGPEVIASSEGLSQERRIEAIFDQTSLSTIDTSGVPEAFSGYFFVFEDSIAGWSNPSSESLAWLKTREEIITYEVTEGDSPASIASRFGISVGTVLWANNLQGGSVIRPGQKLVILPVSGLLHEVKSGETLSQIAKFYGASESRIVAVNNFDSNSTLLPGDRLIIPGAKPPGWRPSVATQTPSTPVRQIAGFFRSPTTGLNWGKLHRVNAVDIANACGTPVFAAASGFVSDASFGSWNSGYGNVVKIKHENSTETVYAHLSAVLVSQGAYVNQGDIIGAIGNTGKTHGITGCHLHFEVRGAANPFARY